MGTCRCCGAETTNGFKLCWDCDSAARSQPCRGCTTKHRACHDTCERHIKRTRALNTIAELRKEEAKWAKYKYKQTINNRQQTTDKLTFAISTTRCNCTGFLFGLA